MSISPKRFALAAAAALLSVALAGCTAPGASNEPPVAAFDLERDVVEVDDLVVFSGNNSQDREGPISTFQWNFGDNAAEVGPVVAHRYAASGTYTVTLTVTDNQGASNTRAANVTVNAKPVAVLDMSPGPYFAKEPISFSGSLSSDSDGRIAVYAWSFGDGATANTADTSHAYTESGTFEVALDVTDDRGAHARVTSTLFADLHTYSVDFSERTQQVDQSRNFTIANMTKTTTVELFLLNVTKLVFRLNWTDFFPPGPLGPPNDVIRMTVSGPDGGSQTAEGDWDNITLEFNLNAIPSPVQTRAASPDDVPLVLGEAYLGEKGRGVWVVEITALDLNGGIINGEGGIVPEPLFFWTLTTVGTLYEADPTQIG